MTAYPCSAAGCDQTVPRDGNYCSRECKYPRCEVCSDHEHGHCYRDAVQFGAAVAFGLMGMAQAIRRRAWCPHGNAYPGECLDCLDGGYDEPEVDESILQKVRWVDGVGFERVADDRSEAQNDVA